MSEMTQFSLDDRLELVKSLGIAFIKSKPGKSTIKLQYLNFGWETLS